MSDEHDKLVEDCARTIYENRFPGSEVAEHFEWFHAGKSNPDSCVHYSNVAFALCDARVATAIAVEKCAAVAESTYSDQGFHDYYIQAGARIASRIRALLSPNDRGE